MSSMAPPWALFAEAMDGSNDTHLPRGIHVRALPSPRAGLPATPLFVYRAVLAKENVEQLAQRTDITWIDSQGNVLVPPFSVTPDNPVTGHLASAACVWIELLGQPAVKQRLVRPAGMAPIAPIAPIANNLVFEALINAQDGPSAFAARTQPRYVLAAQRIDLVRVRGQGQVTGVRWIPRDELIKHAKPVLWRIWSLPTTDTPRYTPMPDALDQARARVHRGAPTRQPMYVAHDAPDPGSAPAASPEDAMKRVDATAAVLLGWLDKVLNDLGVPPWLVSETHEIDEANGKVSLPVEGHILASAVDPETGRWLGFGDADETLAPGEGALVVHVVRGLWRWDPERWDTLQRSALAPWIRAKRDDALEEFPELEVHKVAPRLDGSYIDLAALALAVAGIPPARPVRPVLDGFEDRGWLPEPPPPEVRRIVRVRASDFVPRALVALAAEDARGKRILNPFPKIGRLPPGKTPRGTPMALVVTRPSDATGPGQSRFDDRDAPEGEVLYRMAQGDWFGRWSEWSERLAPAKSRSVPLPPVVELYYTPLLLPDGSVPLEDVEGLLTMRVPVPRAPELPAGGHPLHKLVVDLSIDDGPPARTEYVLGSLNGGIFEPHPSPEHDMLVIDLACPPTPRAGSRSAHVVAHWVDEGDLVSDSSAPAVRQLMDPRPPPLPAVDTELQYSARPDTTGFARVELAWQSTPGTRYRVFASNETTLLQALRNAGQGAMADQILATAPGAPRAQAFRAHKQLFGWDAFECITPTPIAATSSTTRFVHRVSGSLEVLALYRVLSEGESGVLANMTEAELIPVAVPNLGPPARPLVSVEHPRVGAEPVNHERDGVRLRVKVPAGRAVPVAWRLRRASVPVSDPRRMGVVREGTIPAGSTTAAGTEFVIEDRGPLAAWRQYRWAVEVQAGPPPGAPAQAPPGEWSDASAAATLAVIPAAPPAPPESVVASPATGGVRLIITHPHADRLIGTALGSYRFELHRSSPQQRPQKLALAVTRGPGSTFEAFDPAPPTASQWSVRVIDPTGRVSSAVLSNEV